MQSAAVERYAKSSCTRSLQPLHSARAAPSPECVDCSLPCARAQEHLHCRQRRMSGSHHQGRHAVGIARVHRCKRVRQQRLCVDVWVTCGWDVTCRVVLGEQAHALFVAEGGGKQHGRDGCGIECGLNLLRCTIIKQSCNARGFACSASIRVMRRFSLSVTSKPVAAAPPPPPLPPALACSGCAVQCRQSIAVESVGYISRTASARKQ